MPTVDVHYYYENHDASFQRVLYLLLQAALCVCVREQMLSLLFISHTANLFVI